MRRNRLGSSRRASAAIVARTRAARRAWTEYDASRIEARLDAAGRDIVYVLQPAGAAGPAFEFANPDFNFRSLRGNAVLRWEWRPGSTLFLVWQQARSGSEPFGDFRLGRDLGVESDRRLVLEARSSSGRRGAP